MAGRAFAQDHKVVILGISYHRKNKIMKYEKAKQLNCAVQSWSILGGGWFQLICQSEAIVLLSSIFRFHCEKRPSWMDSLSRCSHCFMFKVMVMTSTCLTFTKKSCASSKPSNFQPIWAGALVQWLWEEDSRSKGRGFKSQHCILDRHFSHLFVVRIIMFVWKDENKLKRGQGWPIFKKNFYLPRTLILSLSLFSPNHTQTHSISFIYLLSLSFSLRNFHSLFSPPSLQKQTFSSQNTHLLR